MPSNLRGIPRILVFETEFNDKKFRNLGHALMRSGS
jgi:hypothetical protein